jgi:hypothetical protein
MPKILMHRKHNNVNAAPGMLPTESYLWPFIHNIFKPILLTLNFGLEEIKFQESPTRCHCSLITTMAAIPHID